MKFLSKLLQLFAKGLTYFNGFSQVITTNNPGLGGVVQTVSKDLGEILDATTDAEKINAAMHDGKLTGEEKAAIAGPLVADIILQSSALSGHKIANVDLFNQGIAKMTSGAADIVNSLHTDGLDAMVVNKSS